MTISEFDESFSSHSVLKSLLSKAVVSFNEADSSKSIQLVKSHSKYDEQNKIKIQLNQQQQQQTAKRIPIEKYHFLKWNWSLSDNEKSIIASEDRKSVCFHSNCSSCYETEAILGNVSIKRNRLTYWEVSMDASIGTSIMVGVGSIKAQLKSAGYLNLIGISNSSWGLSNKGFTWHANKPTSYCAPFERNGNVRVGCLFNGYNSSLTYYVDGICQGVAFKDLPLGVDLYPMISSTVSKCIMRIEFVCESFPTLKEICQNELKPNMTAQNLPKSIINILFS